MIVGIVVGSSIGYGGAHFIYYQKLDELEQSLLTSETLYETLSNKYDSLLQDHEDISINYGAISDKYEHLINEHETLTSQYEILTLQYNSLQRDYDVLQDNYDMVFKNLNYLSDDVRKLENILISYSFFHESISRVLCNRELEKISSTVQSVTGKSSDLWFSYQNIYYYIRDNIDYARDIEFPYIKYSEQNIGGNRIITSIYNYSYRNYIQTPEFTIEYKQRDCDDQAILTYAMIKYYLRNTYGTDYILYLAVITLGEDKSHISVFQPVKEGNLCILDAAGHYLTSVHGSIASRDASLEIQKYSDHWSSSEDYEEITNIELIKVNVEDGSYTITISGDIEEVSIFLES